MIKVSLIFLSFLLLMGCAGVNQNVTPGEIQDNAQYLREVGEFLDDHADALAEYGPAALAFMRFFVGENNLTKEVVDNLNVIESILKKEDTWLTAEEIKQLSMYDKWTIASIRLSHTQPAIQAVIKTRFQWVLGIEEVARIVSFLFPGILAAL